MLFYLLSAEELGALMHRSGYYWSPSRIPETIDYYLARTSNGSTLSSVVHAWVLARANRERAFDEFVEALAAMRGRAGRDHRERGHTPGRYGRHRRRSAAMLRGRGDPR